MVSLFRCLVARGCRKRGNRQTDFCGRNVGRLASMTDRQTQRTKYRNPRCARVNNKATFVGEGAIDSGGPRREFFRLFAQQMFLVSSPACKYSNVSAILYR